MDQGKSFLFLVLLPFELTLNTMRECWFFVGLLTLRENWRAVSVETVGFGGYSSF